MNISVSWGRSRSAAAIKTIPGVCIDVSHGIEIKIILQ